MKTWLLSVCAFLLTAVPVLFAQHRLAYDGFDSIESMQRRVRDVIEVDRMPLFDNAPFLKLRKGDKLVKAKEEVHQYDKPRPDPDRINYYLFSGGSYYQLWTEEKDGKVLLSAPFYAADSCLLFDWELTMANAKALRQLLPRSYARSLSIADFDAVAAVVRGRFPEVMEKTDGGVRPELHEDRIRSIPGHAFAEFHGLAFDGFSNCFYQYSVKIGPEVCSIDERTLLQGPGHIERHEFERVMIDGPNGNPGADVDPAVAKIKKAEYDKMLQFRKLVEDTLSARSSLR
ncbi:hypothetical protein [Prosthecobacter fluviatilis]|uniref:Uncharacterized protein n=1 Tax=Prosthecobacter fluviatilis TaxID=445931 RepID=A0ABW0KJZ8_9BACT